MEKYEPTVKSVVFVCYEWVAERREWDERSEREREGVNSSEERFLGLNREIIVLIIPIVVNISCEL